MRQATADVSLRRGPGYYLDVGRLVARRWTGDLRRHLPGGSAFFASRVLNAILVIGQLALIARLYTSGESARFFVYWTVVWCGSVWLRFGFDQLVPKHAAVAQLSGDRSQLGGFARILRWTLPTLTAGSLPLLIALVPHVSVGEVLLALPALLLASLGWMAAYVLGGLAKGYGHVGLSGFVVGVVPAACSLGAVPAARLVSGSWLAVAWISAVALLVAALIALWLLSRAVGRPEVQTLFAGGWAGRPDPDVLPAGILFGIGEASIWLPLWIGSALSLSSESLAGLYAAIRVSSVFSWLFASIVNVVTPMLSRALAEHDYARVRRLLISSARFGAITTGPVALVGMLMADRILTLIHASYGAYGDVLVVLIAARLVDAATGAVAESLVLGYRAATELCNQLVAVAVIVALSAVLRGPLGVLGLGVSFAAAFSLVNVIRVAEVWWLMHGPWRPLGEPPPHGGPVALPSLLNRGLNQN